ncbi:MAG: hypothetical protein ABL998_18835 [Planctomycetota bacterium]
MRQTVRIGAQEVTARVGLTQERRTPSMEGMGTHLSSEGRPRAPYCLACYAPMEREPGASHRCERCGFVNVKLDQELFWTKEPRLVALESYAKIVIVCVLVALTAFVFWAMGQRASYGMGQGWAIGFPILLGVVLWDTASAITRKRSDLRATIVWRIVCAVLAPWPLLLAIDLRPGRMLKSDFPVSPALWALLLLLGLAFLAGALGLGRLGRFLQHWRERHVLAAQVANPR